MPDKRPLTDSEGALLALVLQQQPVTGYQIARFFDSSPVHTFNTSKGKLYPLLHRLEKRGLLRAEAVPGDNRGTQRFLCTEAGVEVLKKWVLSVRPEHDLLQDPFRKKVQAFSLLSQREQLAWVEETRVQLQRKLRDVEQWNIEAEGPYGELIRANARSALKSRIEWLETVARTVASSPASDAA